MGKCNHIRGALFAIEDYYKIVAQTSWTFNLYFMTVTLGCAMKPECCCEAAWISPNQKNTISQEKNSAASKSRHVWSKATKSAYSEKNRILRNFVKICLPSISSCFTWHQTAQALMIQHQIKRRVIKTTHLSLTAVTLLQIILKVLQMCLLTTWQFQGQKYLKVKDSQGANPKMNSGSTSSSYCGPLQISEKQWKLEWNPPINWTYSIPNLSHRQYGTVLKVKRELLVST